MRTIKVLAIVLALAPSLSLAGEIYGRVTESGKPVGEGVPVEIRCGDKSYPPQKTDKDGSYHVVVDQEGKCRLTVTYKSQPASLDVVSYTEGVQVDLVLELKEGKYVARRK